MRVKFAMSTHLLAWLCLASACGQQAAPPPTQSSATRTKGQIAEATVKPGKATDASSLLVSFHGCADLVLVDPRERKLGYDASSKKNYQEIPRGIYDEGDIIDDDEDNTSPTAGAKPTNSRNCASDKILQVPQPVRGSYNLRIDNPTGNPFKLEITSYGNDSRQNGHSSVVQPMTTPGSSTFQFQLPPSPDGVLEVNPGVKPKK